MKPSETLLNVRNDLDTVLTKRNEGTADYPRSIPRIDTGYQRALDRAGAGRVPNGEPDLTDDELEKLVEVDSEMSEERRNQERVKRQAERDAWELEARVTRMRVDAAAIRVIVDRQAEIVHESKLPTDVLPGCRSCARKEDHDGKTIGGNWAGVTDKAPASGLCRDCNDFKNATDGLPPIIYCHMVHTVGKKQANRWLARVFPNLMNSIERKDKPKTNITVEDLALRPEALIEVSTT